MVSPKMINFLLYSILVACIALFGRLDAQDRTTGYSAPGTLGKQKAKTEISKNDILCTVYMLEEDSLRISTKETELQIGIMIRNLNPDYSIEPSLEIFLLPRGSGKPVLKIKNIEPVGPDTVVVYREYLKWKPGYPAGHLIYRVHIRDTASGVYSRPFDLGIYLERPGSGKREQFSG
jgi:hypothetical protein